MKPHSVVQDDNARVDNAHPVISTRYDPVRVRWAMRELGLSKKAHLVRLALDAFIDDLNRQSAA